MGHNSVCRSSYIHVHRRVDSCMPMTTPVDRVESLARRLWKLVKCERHGKTDCRSCTRRLDPDEAARAALAHARGLVPEVEELAQIISGCDPGKWPALINHNDAWSETYRRTARRVRAETLRRLGGEESA